MTDFEIEINLDTKAYTEKPKDSLEIRAIQWRLRRSRKIMFSDFAKEVCNGHSFRQCKADGMSGNDFISTRLLAVDIDNKNPDTYLGIDEAIKRATENRLTINFMYPSFRDKPDHRKYRMVFLLDKPITSIEGFEKAYNYLIYVFPNCDTSCRNQAHFFFGTMADPIILNTERLNSRKSLLSRKIPQEARKQGKKATKNTKTVKCAVNADGGNIKAIQEHDVEYLKKKLKRKKTVFHNRDEFFRWLYHDVDLMELLEVPKNFNCIFHDDENASASVFRTSYGTWKYKCFAESCEVDTLNVKELVELLGNFKSEYAALEFIKAIYNVSIQKTAWAIEQEENIDSIMDCLKSRAEDGFINCCPHAFQTTRYAVDVFDAILRIAKRSIYPERTAEDSGIIFYMSMRQLMKEAGASSLDKVNKRVKMLIYHGMLEIVPDDKVPKSLLTKVLQYRGERSNHVQFYSIPSWVVQQKRYIDSQGERWKSNGYRVAGISYEMFYRTEGQEVASRLYPQTSKYTDEHGQIQIKAPSNKSDERSAKIADFILQEIRTKGYTTEKEVLASLKGSMGKIMTEVQLKRCITEVLDTYGLQKVRATKELKERYQMELPPRSNPVIIIEA